MKIVVLSDTHMPKKSKELPLEVIQSIENTDHILHLGDWQTLDVYNLLQKYAPLDGVAGNVDGKELSEQLGFKKILSFHGFRFGLVHGHLGKGRTTEDRAFRSFAHDQIDVILFGHSHIPVLKQVNGITLFNPGSPTDKRREPLFSFGVIEISSSLSIQHVYYHLK
jgi:putative phosphoesterase